MRWLTYFQIIISILLIASILLQQRGTGLGSIFGGEGGVFTTKRGIEKWLLIGTIILSSLLLISALLNIVI